jgi:hypothetical protein
MKLHRLVIVAAVTAVLLSPFNGVQACGPIGEPDVFVQVDSPHSLGDFAQGKLGILQRGYDSNEYVVAYQYLNGGKLSEAERLTIAPQNRGSFVPAAEWRAFHQAELDANPPSAWLLAPAPFPLLAEATGECLFLLLELWFDE